MPGENKVQNIILKSSVRVFQSVSGSLLGNTWYCLAKGDYVNVGNVEIRCFDHQNKEVYPASWKDQSFFILAEELQPSLPTKLVLVK